MLYKKLKKLWLMSITLILWNVGQIEIDVICMLMYLLSQNSQWKFYFWCLNVTERVSVTSINVGKLGFRKKIAVNRCK